MNIANNWDEWDEWDEWDRWDNWDTRPGLAICDVGLGIWDLAFFRIVNC